MTPLASRIASLLVPLSEFYAETGKDAPAVREIDGAAMPRPYRDLLVHEDDMTPTLERYWGKRIHLRLLDMEVDDGVLTRQVVLETDGARTPTEFGAIRIFLSHFGAEAKRLVLEGKVPLGTILHDCAIPHHSHPTGYFSVRCDEVIAEALGLGDERPTLYGRHNILHANGADDPGGDASGGDPIAEVVEILPPMRERGNP